MVTAVDSSVLLDVLLDDPLYATDSIAALRQGSLEGSLVICETVLAEVVPALSSNEILEFLKEWNISFSASTLESAILAGEMFRRFLERGGKRGRVVGDLGLATGARRFRQPKPRRPIPCRKRLGT